METRISLESFKKLIQAWGIYKRGLLLPHTQIFNDGIGVA